MEISFNIKDLLEKSNQVILPGLGSFYLKRIEGFYDDNEHTFYPPKETIEFTTSEVNTHPDQKDALIEFICDSKNVSATSAQYILSKQVEDLKNNLKENGEVSFQDIGKLKLRNSDIFLETEQQENSGNAFFGLPSFTLPKVENKETPIEKVEISTNFSLAEQALSASVSDEEILSERANPKSKTLLYILLTVLIIGLSLSALYLSRPDIYNSIFNPNLNNADTKTVMPVVTSEERDSIIADSIYKDNVIKNLESEGFEVETVKDSTDITIHQKTVPNKNNIRYEIIIAAWQTRTKAEDHLKKLRANGIDAHIVEDADGLMVKISAATLYNKQDAEKEEKRIKEELNPEAFIKPIKTLK